MKLVNSPSKTEQIRSFFEKEIRSGRYETGQRLEPMRDYALRFGVSIRIIHLVFKRLEKARLIVIQQGRGVFVGDYKKHEHIEGFFLLWGLPDQHNEYLNELVKLAFPPKLKKGFSFTVRSVYNEKSSYQILKRELSFVNALPEVRCLLVNALSLTNRQLKAFEDLLCPVIFLGNSVDKTIDEQLPCQITGDNRLLGMHMVEFMKNMKKLGVKNEINLFSLSKHYFHNLFIEGVKDAAERRGIKVNFYEIPNLAYTDYSFTTYKRVFDKAKAAGKLNLPTILYDFNEIAMRELVPLYLPAKTGRPVLTAAYSADHFDCFFNKIFERMKCLSNQPEETFRDKLDLPFIIHNLDSSESFVCGE